MLRIIHVEDNDSNLALVERIADMGNYQIIAYRDAEAALENFELDQPDVVLADYRLAGEMDGLQMARILREAGYNNPIVSLSAYATRQEAEAAGCDEWFEKPVPIQGLLDLLNYYASMIYSDTDEQ